MSTDIIDANKTFLGHFNLFSRIINCHITCCNCWTDLDEANIWSDPRCKEIIRAESSMKDLS